MLRIGWKINDEHQERKNPFIAMTNHGQLPQVSSITTQLSIAYLSSDVLNTHSTAQPQSSTKTEFIKKKSSRHKQKINYSATAMKRWQFKISGVILIVTY
jgi:predicted nucleic acid binding AN1-type Zn finger protein